MKDQQDKENASGEIGISKKPINYDGQTGLVGIAISAKNCRELQEEDHAEQQTRKEGEAVQVLGFVLQGHKQLAMLFSAFNCTYFLEGMQANQHPA
ncbi:MAG TPA: hypothetical protein VNY24_17910 [Candidatus Acidoferrales bacterium]|nr:hypothetical protein [Candidatus Acidoferrales bacterium]